MSIKAESVHPVLPPPEIEAVDHIAVTQAYYEERGFDSYNWASNPEPSALTPLSKPLSRSRLALLASGGIYRRGQIGFTYKDDISYRRVPLDTPSSELGFVHLGYDLRGARRDPGAVFPARALRVLEQEGLIGELCNDALTFMGGIYSQRRVREELIPVLVKEVEAMKADAVLLVPVCPICHQTSALLARELEAQGCATLCLTSAWSITALANPPRAAFTDFPLGHTSGEPGTFDQQCALLREALPLLESAQCPATFKDLKCQWSSPWKHLDLNADAGIDWPPRLATPQYQSEEHRDAAVAEHGTEAALGSV